jgi:hypothetical protein
MLILTLLAGSSILSACSSGGGSSGGVASTLTVRGIGVLYGIACPTSNTCEAVGATAPNGEGAVVSLSGGHAGPVQLVQGTKAVTAVACASATSCTAVGVGAGHGVLVTLESGKPPAAQTVLAVSAFEAMSCAGGECVGGGRSLATGALASGPTAVLTLPGTTSINGVACTGPAICEAIASTSNGKTNDVVVSVTGAKPNPLQVVPPATSTFTGISCHGADTCLIVGRGATAHRGRVTEQAVVASLHSGTPGTAVAVPGSGTLALSSVSCPATGSCVAVGTTTSGGTRPVSHGASVVISQGKPGPVTAISGQSLQLNAVSCPSPTLCWAAGANPSTQRSVVLSFAGPG